MAGLLLGLVPSLLWAGGSGLNVIVVVNQNSPNSLELGNDYCEWRGVPPQNVLRITNWTGGSLNWTPANFTNYLLQPLQMLIANQGLTNQVQFVLLAMDIPYRVTDGNNVNSTTAALFYGFVTNGAPVSGVATCSLPDRSSNSYAYSELPFRQVPPNAANTNGWLAMMLTDTSLAGAEATLRRGVLADHSYPTQTVYLAKSTDNVRNVRFLEFNNAIFENQIAGNYALVRTNTSSTAFTNAFGLLTGLANFSVPANAYAPGAISDSLTSFGGYILEGSGQTPLLAFLEAGASASYGTVAEPCNYTQKFPDPVDYFYQTRGFTLAEAYYQSVLNPFQGLFAGEPLAAPFARPGSAIWPGLTNHASLSGVVALNLVFTAAATNLPLTRADLYVDGTFWQTLTNLAPAPGNVLNVTLNGQTFNYNVPAQASLASLATGLATTLNAQSNLTQVIAMAVGDRVELQSQSLTAPGSNVTVSAGVALGTAPVLTTRLTAARPAFLDTVATGWQYLEIDNAPILGDYIELAILKTNGTMVTLAVTNTTSGTTVGKMVQNLMNLINSAPQLQAANGCYADDYFDDDPYGAPIAYFFLYPRTPGLAAAQILTTLTTSTNLVQTRAYPSTPVGTDPLADNLSDLWPRNHLYLASGTSTLSLNYPLDTTSLADGWHQLTVVATEGTSVQTQTAITRTVQINNTGLTASLTGAPTGTNILLSQPLKLTVAASPVTNAPIASITIASTGGTVAAATNQATATFTINLASLGIGLHPFTALVTDQAGHRYHTQTLYYRATPAFNLALVGSPPVLSWPATYGANYAIQSTPNLSLPFQTLTNLTATNVTAYWPLPPGFGSAFYRVQFNP